MSSMFGRFFREKDEAEAQKAAEELAVMQAERASVTVPANVALDPQAVPEQSDFDRALDALDARLKADGVYR